MKKLFSKKKNELKKANKSGNSREAVEKAEQGFKALTFLSWLDKHLQLRETKSNFPKLPVIETNGASFEQSAPSNHSTDGYNSSENDEEDGSEKYCEVEENQGDSPGSSSFSRKRDLIPHKPLGQKRKQLKTNDDETLEIMREIRERFNHRKNHQTDAEDRFAASLADDLRSLPEKEKFMAKLEIRNVIYKFQMKKFNSPKSNETSSNYNIYNPSPFEGPFRVDNNSYLQGTFRSTGNSHNFSVPANNFTCNKTANGNNIYENL